MEELAVKCDEVADLWFGVWDLGRQAIGKPGGPSEDEVEDAFDKAWAWHHMAETLRNQGSHQPHCKLPAQGRGHRPGRTS